MGKRRGIKENGEKTSTIRNKDVSRAVKLNEDDWDRDKPLLFSFRDTDKNRFVLWDLVKKELKELVKTFKLMEQLGWQGVFQHSGLKPEIHKQEQLRFKLPVDLSPDVDIYSFRFSEKGRIFGYRIKNVFYLIWFDRNHDVYPMS